MTTIRNKNFIKIVKHNDFYYGGNQSWWKNENQTMKEFGCGVIAMCDYELYVGGLGKSGIAYEDYIDYVNKRRNQVYKLSDNRNLRKLGLLPTIMEKGLDEFYNANNINPTISWAPTLRKNRVKKLIYNMLSNNMPVVASYYVFNKKNKLDLYTYDDVENEFKKADDIRRHYFNIVGITKRDNQELLIVSTWGRKYYILFQQWLEKLSLFSNILYVELEKEKI
ncbi:MAG: hypothetical protein E7263_06415 [Lachnospiraceae bacterium]|nr:hypothetical protein [Lachnospiraceae bacterium]